MGILNRLQSDHVRIVYYFRQQRSFLMHCIQNSNKMSHKQMFQWSFFFEIFFLGDEKKNVLSFITSERARIFKQWTNRIFFSFYYWLSILYRVILNWSYRWFWLNLIWLKIFFSSFVCLKERKKKAEIFSLQRSQRNDYRMTLKYLWCI